MLRAQTKLIGAMDALGEDEQFEPSTASPADRTAAHERMEHWRSVENVPFSDTRLMAHLSPAAMMMAVAAL